jgi:hypothetical protein
MNEMTAAASTIDELEAEILDSWYETHRWPDDQERTCLACAYRIGADKGHDDDCVIGKAEPALKELIARAKEHS